MTTSLTDVTGIGPATAKTLAGHNIRTVPDLATATEDDLSAIPGLGGERAQRVIDAARALLAEGGSTGTPVEAGKKASADEETKKTPERNGDKEKSEKSKDKKGKKGKKDKKRKKDKKGKKGKKDKKHKRKG